MRKIITIFLTLGICTVSIFSVAAENGNGKQIFPDVTDAHWAFDAIGNMAEKNIISGYPDGTFKPEDNVKRGEFARIIASAAGLTITPDGQTSFADVESGAWYAPYIEAAKDILRGYDTDGQTVYRPEEKAIREDIAVAMVKMKGYDVSGADTNILEKVFTDSTEISESLQKYIAVAIEKGLISGYENNTFKPKGNITRAEAASLLWRACNAGDDKPVIPEETPVPTPTPSEKPMPTPTPEKIEPDEAPYSFDTTFAVVQKEVERYILSDDEEVDMVQVLYKGVKKEKLIFKDGVWEDSGLGFGDVFFFGTNRHGFVDEVYLIYDYSEDTFGNLIAADWSCNLWDEGKDYQLAEGYVVSATGSEIVLAPRAAIVAGRLDTNEDVEDNHEDGTAIFDLDENCLIYEFDAYNDDIIGVANRMEIKKYVKASRFDRFEVDDQRGVFEGELADYANLAIIIAEDGVVTEIYTIVK